MELLLPMAAKKLELSFTIDPDVPTWSVNSISPRSQAYILS